MSELFFVFLWQDSRWVTIWSVLEETTSSSIATRPPVRLSTMLCWPIQCILYHRHRQAPPSTVSGVRFLESSVDRCVSRTYTTRTHYACCGRPTVSRGGDWTRLSLNLSICNTLAMKGRNGWVIRISVWRTWKECTDTQNFQFASKDSTSGMVRECLED